MFLLTPCYEIAIEFKVSSTLRWFELGIAFLTINILQEVEAKHIHGAPSEKKWQIVFLLGDQET